MYKNQLNQEIFSSKLNLCVVDDVLLLTIPGLSFCYVSVELNRPYVLTCEDIAVRTNNALGDKLFLYLHLMLQ